jgi:hypothetical protein
MWESHKLFFGLRLVSRIFEEFQHPAIKTKIVQHFCGFVHQIKVRQPIGKKDSVQTVGTSEIKNQKHIAVYVLFKSYPQWYHHSHADPIWPDGTFKYTLVKYSVFGRYTEICKSIASKRGRCTGHSLELSAVVRPLPRPHPRSLPHMLRHAQRMRTGTELSSEMFSIWDCEKTKTRHYLDFFYC